MDYHLPTTSAKVPDGIYKQTIQADQESRKFDIKFPNALVSEGSNTNQKLNYKSFAKAELKK